MAISYCICLRLYVFKIKSSQSTHTGRKRGGTITTIKSYTCTQASLRLTSVLRPRPDPLCVSTHLHLGPALHSHYPNSRVTLYQAVGRGSPLKQLRIRGHRHASAPLGLLLMRNAEKDAPDSGEGEGPGGNETGALSLPCCHQDILSQGGLYGGSRGERKITYANMLCWDGWETQGGQRHPSMPCCGAGVCGGIGDQIEISAMEFGGGGVSCLASN